MSEQNDFNPDSMSSVLGEVSQNVNTPYMETDMSGVETPGLNDIIDQPKLANPGSNDNILISESDAATVGRLMDSIQVYLRKERVKLDDVAFYIMAITKYNNGSTMTMGPAIFDEDYHYIGGKRYTQCLDRPDKLVGEFLAKKRCFNDGCYGSEVLGFVHQIVPRSKLVHERLIEWQFSNVPFLRTPKIVGLKTSKSD